MQLSKEAKEWVASCSEKEALKLNDRIEEDANELDYPVKRYGSKVDINEVKALLVGRTKDFALKVVEIYVNGFKEDKKLIDDLDQEEILGEIGTIIEKRYEFNKSALNNLLLDNVKTVNEKKIFDQLDIEKTLLIKNVRATLSESKAKMILRNKGKGNSNENKTNQQTAYLVRKIDLIREELNELQRRVINLTFEAMVIDNEKKVTEISLCLKIKIDEGTLKSELGKLGGRVFYTTQEDPTKRKCGLYFVGLLLADKGKEIEGLIKLYLGFVKEQIELNHEITFIKLKEAAESLKLNDEEYKLLDLCFNVGYNPFGYITTGSRAEPNISLPTKVTILHSTNDIEGFFYTELNGGINTNIPIELDKQTLVDRKNSLASKNNPFKLELPKSIVNSLQKENAEGKNKLKKISWLHLTDLHRGMVQQKTLWAAVREEFYRDLKRVAERSGLWDMVLFTGDLTQYGREEDFELLEITLLELWEVFDILGCKPLLLPVPGNHDLLRPTPETKISRAKKVDVEDLKFFDLWDKEIREAFWKNKNSKYRKVIEKVFSNYEEWQDRTKVPLAKKSDKCKYQAGLLPGDFSASIEVKGVMVGIVGLNSTFLQLRSGNFEGRLDINKSQVDKACGGDLHKWVKENHINILMTHQPPNWFSPDALKHFKANILDRDNFTFHIYGHMHEGSSEEVSIAGSQTHREIQGASLFGYEEWVKNNEQQVQRIHGYNAVNITVSDEKGEVRVWPRLLVTTRQGYQKLVPDYNFDLKEEFYITIIPIRTTVPLVESVTDRKENLDEEMLLPKSNSKKQVEENLSLEVTSAKLDISRQLKDNTNSTTALKMRDKSAYLCQWDVGIAVYVEKFVDNVVSMFRHKSSIYFEVLGIVEKTVFKKWRFSQRRKDALIKVINGDEVQINGHGKFEIFGTVTMPFPDGLDIDNMSRPIFCESIADVRACIGVSLWLAGKSKTIELIIDIPLHSCGQLHFGEGYN